MFPYHSFVALWLVSISAGAVFQRRGSDESAPYSNVTLISSLSAPTSTVSSEIYSTINAGISSSQESTDGFETGFSNENGESRPIDTRASAITASTGFTNAAPSAVELFLNATSVPTVIATIFSAVSDPFPNATLSTPYVFPNATASASRKPSNATCTVNIPSASIDWWYPPTYSHVLATMTTAAPNFTNVDSYTLIPHTTTFDAASALESDFACTSSYSYVSEWDFTLTMCMEYTEKPTAAVTSIAYRTAAAPFPPGGLIPISDATLYDLYTDGQPSATATISIAPNVTHTETSATPFVYFTAYEIESGNTTETVQLRSTYAYPYWLKGVEQETIATGSLPEGFIEQIPQSACDAGQLQATVTVLIVVDLYYQNWPNANPFIVHFESTALGFDDPPVVINNHGSSRPAPLTIADWDLPGATKPTSVSLKPNQRPDPAPTTNGRSNNAGSQGPQVPNLPQPTQVTVGTIGTVPVVIGPSSEVVVGSQTLRPGGPAITVGGTTAVSLAPSATAIIVGGTTSQLPQVFVPPAQSPGRPPPVLTIGSSTLTPNAATQFFVAPGQTLTPGGIATVDGTVVSLAPSASFVVIGGSTQILPTAGSGSAPVATGPPEIVFGGTTVTAQPTLGRSGNSDGQNNPGVGPTFVISDQTLAPGGPAITVSGTTLSLAPSGSFIVVNGVTSTVANPTALATSPPTLTVGESVFSPLPGSGTTFVISDQTLAPGGPAITVSGTTISLAPSASFVVINGVTSTIANPFAAQITAPPLTIGTDVFIPLPGTGTSYLIGSRILTPGGVVVSAGMTISLAPGATALIVNGQTSLIAPQAQPIITNAPLLTIGSQTYTAVAGTTFVINGQTLTPGGTITVDGTTISLAPGATELIYGSSGRSTTTALFPATTTRSQSVTSASKPSAGASGSNGQAAPTSQQGAASKPQMQSWLLASFITIITLFLA
ncbi:Nn.00g013770.m01.CDS01 [Neocucurbitaria sp. VM-36]